MKNNIFINAKRVCILFLILIFIFNTGCTSEKETVVSESKYDVLKINIFSDDNIVSKAIDEFNKLNKIKIKPNIIKMESQSDVDDYRSKLASSVSAGQGPDIVYDYPESLPSLWKMIKSGAFCDLNELISDDKTFDLKDYNSKVFDCGVINNKRYFIPLYFKVSLLWSSSSILNSNNLIINDDGWTWDDFGKLCIKYIDKNSAKEKYFVGNAFNFETIMKNCWLDYIDYSKKEANFESNDFISLLTNYKKIYQYILPDKKLRAPDIYFKYLKNNSLALVNGDNSIIYMWINSSWVNKVLDSEINCFPYPSSRKNGINAQVTKFAVINQNCKHKKEALDFIELLLSEKYQNNETDTKWAPVNISAFNKIQKQYSGNAGDNKPVANFQLNNNKPYTSVSLPDKTIGQLNAYCENIEKCSYIDSNIMSIINQEVEAYISGKQSVSQTARLINNRVKIYMNE